jgi:putative membrane protein
MFYNHHFFDMHWIWWIVISIGLLLVSLDMIPYWRNRDVREDAMDILTKRFARGEIEREEFEERKKVLKLNK